MATINTNLSTDLVKFTFTDEDGEVFAYFRMNPADVKFQNRVKGAQNKLEEIKEKFRGREDDEQLQIDVNDALEELFSWLFGYDVKDSLFGFLSATAVMSDGEQFFEKVLRVVTENVTPEIEKRAKLMQSRMSKYTGAYK